MADDLVVGILAHRHGDVTASVLHSTGSCICLARMRWPKHNFQKVTKMTLIQIRNEHVSKIYVSKIYVTH